MVRVSRFFGISMVVLGCALLVGCTPKPQLSVDSLTLNVGPDATTASFNVFNSGAAKSTLEIKVAKAAADTWYAIDVTSGKSTSATDKKKVTLTINQGAAKAVPDKSGIITVTATVDGTEQKKTVNVSKGHNFFTEVFSEGSASTLAGKSLIFTPLPNSVSKYALTVVEDTAAKALPVDPAGGTIIDFNAADPAVVALTNAFNFYGTDYMSVDVSSKGYLGFAADPDATDTGLADHFSIPRISVLTGVDATLVTGSVSYKDLADRLAVTYQDVPNAESTTVDPPQNTAQAELFTDEANVGTIRLSYLTVITEDSIVGLSDGGGATGFVGSNLTQNYNTAPLAQ